MNMAKMNEEIIALKQEMTRMKAIIEEDLEFARRTEEAWQEIDEGKCRTMSKEDFLNEMEKW